MRIKFFIDEAVVNFRRNWVMSIAAVSTVAVSLFTIGIFLIVGFVLNNIIVQQEKKVEIAVYLKEGAPQERIAELEKKIISWSEIESVDYVSKEEALKRMREWYGEKSSVLENLPGNPLPASLEIELKEPETVKEVAGRIKMPEVVDEVSYGEEQTIERLFAITRGIRWVGIIFGLLLCIDSLVLISNTIRLAIFARRKEVSIMKLVGATNWFVRLPFMLEGVIQGVLGAFVAAFTLYFIKVSFSEHLISFLSWLRVSVNIDHLFAQFYMLLGMLIVTGALIGATGSLISLKRYLKI
ncbi:MAG: permease-like cell division protein FtsX [Candidatus Subteraquimicrobiales bacterium]|nr:permease-like cell division protein FtsX [Candidatus Subteraquimicrobiales bacterium]